MGLRTALSVLRHSRRVQRRATRRFLSRKSGCQLAWHGTGLRNHGCTVCRSRMASTATTFVPFSPSNVGPDEIEEVVATLESGWLTTGPRVRRFESEFAAYTGAPHAV